MNKLLLSSCAASRTEEFTVEKLRNHRERFYDSNFSFLTQPKSVGGKPFKDFSLVLVCRAHSVPVETAADDNEHTLLEALTCFLKCGGGGRLDGAKS